MLKPLKSKKARNFNYAVYDVETDNWSDFRQVGFFDGEHYETFTDLNKFIKYLIRRKYDNYVFFAHAGARFDIGFVISELYNYYDKYNITTLAGATSPFLLFMKEKAKGGLKFTFADSFRILPMSLKRLTQTFDVTHKKLDNEFKTIIKKIDDWYVMESVNTYSEMDNKEKYLMYDCMGLYEVIEQFYELIKSLGGGQKLTLASTAMDLFRRKYLKHHIPGHQSYEKWVRDGYYGGRCEVFKIYGRDLMYYDFNSLYPSIMHDHKVPVGNAYIDKDVNACGFSYVKAFVPNMDIPILPVRQDNKLIFPTGKILGWYDNELLRYAEKNGVSFNVIQSINFDEHDYLFRDYVKSLYKVKLQAEKSGNAGLRLIAKLLLNSLYGKFGQRREVDQFCFCPEVIEDKAPYNEDKGLYIESKISRSNFILPAISAHITAMAQIKLHKSLIDCGNVWYCDTDSIITDESLKTSNKLGGLKIEHYIDEGLFLRPKIYALKLDKETLIKAKGFSRELREHLKFDEVMQNGVNCFKERGVKFLSIKSSLKRNKEYVSTAMVKRSIINPYDKRIINGNDTVPLRVSQW